MTKIGDTVEIKGSDTYTNGTVIGEEKRFIVKWICKTKDKTYEWEESMNENVIQPKGAK